jgi:hypothetical protein
VPTWSSHSNLQATPAGGVPCPGKSARRFCRDAIRLSAWGGIIEKAISAMVDPRVARTGLFAGVGFAEGGQAAENVLAETLCVEEERVVGRDNTVAYLRLRLQLPESPMRPHYVKARVRVRHYPDGSLAIWHGPRCLCRYDRDGREIAAQSVRWRRAAAGHSLSVPRGVLVWLWFGANQQIEHVRLERRRHCIQVSIPNDHGAVCNVCGIQGRFQRVSYLGR